MPENDVFINVDVHSLILSELNYEIQFRHQRGSSTADVENIIFPRPGRFDALFGSQRTLLDPLEDSRILTGGTRTQTVLTRILNDFSPEELECYTLQILSPDVIGERDNFECYGDGDDPTDFFCLHTICITDNDG